jgi:hypothetical protein
MWELQCIGAKCAFVAEICALVSFAGCIYIMYRSQYSFIALFQDVAAFHICIASGRHFLGQ